MRVFVVAVLACHPCACLLTCLAQRPPASLFSPHPGCSGVWGRLNPPPLSFFPMLRGGFCPMCVVSLVCPLFAATAWRLLPAVWCVVSSSLPAKPSAACVLLVGWCVRVCVEVMGPLVEGPALLLHYYPTQACVPCFYVVHMLTQCFGAKVVCLYACLTS
jgi:hypothetical protein